jgi:hypothetical protein
MVKKGTSKTGKKHRAVVAGSHEVVESAIDASKGAGRRSWDSVAGKSRIQEWSNAQGKKQAKSDDE